jgi:DNA-binding transcriptional LysR family regulator
MESLKADELDLVIVPDAFREPQFEIIPLDSVEYAWLCSPGYLGDPAPLPLQELGRYTIIVQRHASGLGDLVRRWLEDNGVAVENSLSSSSLTAIASMTLAGLGISYLPRRISDPLIASGQLRIIHSEPALPRMPYVVLYKKAKADDFMRFVASLATDTCDFSRTMPGFFPARLT